MVDHDRQEKVAIVLWIFVFVVKLPAYVNFCLMMPGDKMILDYATTSVR